MAQGVKTVATKTNDLSSSPRSHMVEGENQLLPVVLYTRAVMVCIHPYTHSSHMHTQMHI